MISPLIKYNELTNINGIEKVAYDTIFTKYMIRGDRGEDKKWEIDSTDQESLVLNKNGGYPLPGFIYIFEYDKKGAVQMLNNGKNSKEFFDVVPLVFCTTINGVKGFEGINFNFLPKLERLKLLEAYYRAYQKFFKDLEKTTQNGELALNKKFINFASSPIGGKIIKLFSKIASGNFSYGYRKYDFTKVSNFRMLEYIEWAYIPFYETKDAFKGANQKEIQSKYWRSDKNI